MAHLGFRRRGVPVASPWAQATMRRDGAYNRLVLSLGIGFFLSRDRAGAAALIRRGDPMNPGQRAVKMAPDTRTVKPANPKKKPSEVFRGLVGETLGRRKHALCERPLGRLGARGNTPAETRDEVGGL